MKPNYFQVFRYKLAEAEEISKIDNESDLDKILGKSKKITTVLTKLLTTQYRYNKEAEKQIREVVSDIRCISYKPTTFRIMIPNGNFFDMKYDPTPLETEYPEDFEPSDSFTIIVSGKKYNIANKSEYEQCLDYINNLLKNGPISKEPEPETPEEESPEEKPAEEPEEKNPEETPEENPTK
jgi:hypothetical protein